QHDLAQAARCFARSGEQRRVARRGPAAPGGAAEVADREADDARRDAGGGARAVPRRVPEAARRAAPGDARPRAPRPRRRQRRGTGPAQGAQRHEVRRAQGLQGQGLMREPAARPLPADDDALLTPSLTAADDAVGFDRPWNPWSLVMLVFFAGPLFGGVLAARNFVRLGQPER